MDVCTCPWGNINISHIISYHITSHQPAAGELQITQAENFPTITIWGSFKLWIPNVTFILHGCASDHQCMNHIECDYMSQQVNSACANPIPARIFWQLILNVNKQKYISEPFLFSNKCWIPRIKFHLKSGIALKSVGSSSEHYMEIAHQREIFLWSRKHHGGVLSAKSNSGWIV